MKILHITPHLGGGIGKVISGLCINDKENIHEIACLEEPVNRHFFDLCIESGIRVYLPTEKELIEAMDCVDIVQVEWWHHPLTVEFMCKYLPKVQTRLLVWSHISGCNYPWISPEFVEFADSFVFATPFSYDNPYYTKTDKERVKTKAKLVVSSGNDFRSMLIQKKPHEGFHVGYVGFLGYEKTRPNFVEICEACADIEGIKFIIVGDLAYGAELLRDVENSKCKEKFVLKGYSHNVQEELADFDVFACLLNREHTGASENALLEAMNAEVCPIVFKQCTEQYLVHDGETGIVCEDENAFVETIHLAAKEREQIEKLGATAGRYIKENLDIQNTVENLACEYQMLIKKEKSLHDGCVVFGDTPKKWFLSCYKGDEHNLQGLAIGESKGSIKQYYKYFKDEELKELMKENGLWQ